MRSLKIKLYIKFVSVYIFGTLINIVKMLRTEFDYLVPVQTSSTFPLTNFPISYEQPHEHKLAIHRFSLFSIISVCVGFIVFGFLCIMIYDSLNKNKWKCKLSKLMDWDHNNLFTCDTEEKAQAPKKPKRRRRRNPKERRNRSMDSPGEFNMDFDAKRIERLKGWQKQGERRSLLGYPQQVSLSPMKSVKPFLPTQPQSFNMSPLNINDGHPLFEAKKRIKKRQHSKNRGHPVRGTKRGRPGSTKPVPPPLIEDYDMTDELPYEDIRVFNVPGDGDCLFHCIKRVLGDLDIEVSIRDLRSIVARNTGEKELEFLRNIYTMAWREGDQSLLSDYSFMINVHTLPQLRQAIMRPSYFGDEMALKAIENVYPVKCMVLRMLPNDKIELAKRFDDHNVNTKPWFSLLLLNLSYQHYELVYFKGRCTMRREDLPPKIQRLLRQQTLETKLKLENKKIPVAKKPNKSQKLSLEPIPAEGLVN